jgi:hypothetical protein
MKRRRRKHAGQKDVQTAKARERKAFASGLQLICERMVGPGYFELFPAWAIADMYQRRYPAFRVMPGNLYKLTASEMALFREVFSLLLSSTHLDTLRGKTLNYKWYMGDVLLLVHYIELGIYGRGGFKGAGRLIEAFQPYFRDSDWYTTWQQKTELFLTYALMYLFDFSKGTMDADIEQLPFRNVEGRNFIRLFRIPPRITRQDIEGISRPVARISWYSTDHHQNYLSVAPAHLGFDTRDKDKPLPVYIQQHVLSRFQERTLFPPGLVSEYLFRILSRQEPHYYRWKNHSLVEFLAGAHKIGYFVVSLHTTSLVVRTFLFLTNDGTPEGRKLAAITNLHLLDKQFLGIDEINAFLQYNIAGDAILRKLFVDAGCGSLLHYVDEYFKERGQPLSSADFIHKYLGSIAGKQNTRSFVSPKKGGH